MTKISIIIPVYNAAPFLEKCVKSVLNQTVTDLEVILVNDESKDNSLEICNAFAKQDKRVKVIDKPNGGVSDARNSGIDNATGDYLMFVDSDDWLSEDALEAFIPHLYTYDIVRCSAYAVYHNKIRRYKLGKWSDKRKVIGAIVARKTIVACWSVMFRRELFIQNNIRFDKNLNIGEDWLVTAQATIACRTFKYLPDVYCYNYNKENIGSCTLNMGKGKIMKQFEVLDKLREIIPTGYDTKFSLTKCIFMQELTDMCGIDESHRILDEAGRTLTIRDIINIWIANISIRKKIMLTRLWLKS